MTSGSSGRASKAKVPAEEQINALKEQAVPPSPARVGVGLERVSARLLSRSEGSVSGTKRTPDGNFPEKPLQAAFAVSSKSSVLFWPLLKPKEEVDY